MSLDRHRYLARFIATAGLALSSCVPRLLPFDAALINARADSKKQAAEQWQAYSAPEVISEIPRMMNVCALGLPPVEEVFTVVVRLVGEGRVAESVVSPATKLSECVRDAISKTSFPKPPWDGYWLEIQMHEGGE